MTEIPAAKGNDPLRLAVKDTAHAPVIFFDGAPNFGNNNGVVNVTLAVALHTLKDDAIDVQVQVAAYLRCSIPGAIALKDALEKALLIGAPTQGPAN